LTLFLAFPAVLLPGCVIYSGSQDSHDANSPAGAKVDFSDPVLNRRQIFLFGSIEQRVAETTIQKLLFLDAKSHEPIDLYLQTPGGEFKHAMAIEQTMRLIQSPVNTYALSECNSGGVVLLAAGTGKRRAFHGSVIIVHGLKIYGRPPAGLKPQVEDAYTDFWRRRARLPESWLPLPNGVIHVLTAEQALQYGLVDEIVGK
jgi:ATP-dependent Clp protease protease subunit